MAQKTLVIAHRGASGSAPENTIPSFRKALEMGVDFIELDIHLSKDGELIVMHDETVSRTTNGKGKIKNLTLSQIKGLDAGSWFSGEYKGLVVPTLDEVFQLVSGKTKLLIEVKGTSVKSKGIEKILIDKIYRYNAKKWCVVQSFDEKILEKIREVDPSVSLHRLISGPIVFQSKKTDDFLALNPHYRFATKRKIEKLHSKNLKIFVWTVNDVEKMKKLIAMGVDGIITNFPEKLKQLQ